MRGDPFGSHRVLKPTGALPQAALRLDTDFSKRFESELRINVATLNIDAASFRQMRSTCAGDAGVGEVVLQTVRDRGKQHNPVTGSGGMLLGSVTQVGPLFPARFGFRPGDRVATLVSLTLTPLRIDTIREVRAGAHQIDVEGEAVLFESGSAVALPTDIPERVALAALDVCGAPSQVQRATSRGDAVLVLGAGGKSGLLCAVQARRAAGPEGVVVGVESSPEAAEQLRGLGVCDAVLAADATDALALRDAVLGATHRREVDVAISCVNVEGAEMAAVLCTRPRGKVVFFAMTTSFTRAALGAEGVSRDVEMLIGNGYAEGHAEHTLGMLRAHPELRAIFEARYG